jgi:hypothetical protein
MNKIIWKYSTLLDNTFKESFSLYMPKGAEILTIQIDQKNNHPTIWAIVDPEAESETRWFELFGTGHTIPENMGVERKYIGTYQYQRGEFVGHLFEKIN